MTFAAGTTDVVVTDGFTGNIALKTGEGALKLAFDLLREGVQREPGGPPRLPARAPWPRTAAAPGSIRGATTARVMLGLNGIVVKSHGGTDAEGFAHALDVAMDMVTHGFGDRIRGRPRALRRACMTPWKDEGKDGPRLAAAQ